MWAAGLLANDDTICEEESEADAAAEHIAALCRYGCGATGGSNSIVREVAAASEAPAAAPAPLKQKLCDFVALLVELPVHVALAFWLAVVLKQR